MLADIVDVVESGSRPKGGAVSNGIPSIGAENIEKFGVYDYSKEKFIDKKFYDKMKRGKVISGDVLLYKDGAYTGKVSLALDGYPHDICAVNEHVFIIRSKQISSQFFLYFCLSDEKNKNYLHTLAASKAAQPGLNQGELLGLPIFIPNPTIVRDFTQSVSPMMHKIAANAIENNKLAAIRDALLPKLMSGEIDVSNVDISALTSTDKLSFRCRSPPKNISYRFSCIRSFVIFLFGNLWSFHSVICDFFIWQFVEFFPYFCTFSALFTGYNVIFKHSLYQTKGNTMKTVKIYMVRKPSDINEVMELCRRYSNQAEDVTVAETVN